jgi:hypothetical protein
VKPPPQTRQSHLRTPRPAIGFAPADRFFFKLSIMKSCPLVPVIGAITAIGPNNADNGGVIYRYIEFREEGGRTRRLTIVRAIAALAALIEQHAIGVFLFWERQEESRLWCVDRADGPQRVDFEALRAYAQTCGRVDAP